MKRYGFFEGPGQGEGRIRAEYGLNNGQSCGPIFLVYPVPHIPRINLNTMYWSWFKLVDWTFLVILAHEAKGVGARGSRGSGRSAAFGLSGSDIALHASFAHTYKGHYPKIGMEAHTRPFLEDSWLKEGPSPRPCEFRV